MSNNIDLEENPASDLAESFEDEPSELDFAVIELRRAIKTLEDSKTHLYPYHEDLAELAARLVQLGKDPADVQ